MSDLWKSAWITGASTGIGRELALALARRGVVVAASARSREGLESLAAEAGAATASGSARILPTPLDITDRAAVKAAAEAAIRVFRGPPDLAVLNAGTYLLMSAADFDAERFRAHVEVNLMGTVHVLEALLPAYLAARKGHIAIVSSVAGYRGLPTSAAYGATKAALINLAESLKYDLDRAGVKLQLVNPGFVKTPLTDKNEFTMPFLMPVEKAVERMIAGFASDRFEIAFPRRFTWQLKLLRLLPHGLYFAITRRRTGA
ncbi:MAG TPA: SDR family NAD(P)-dependent oxidoreductase [Alphaproteobacteria bacterium]